MENTSLGKCCICEKENDSVRNMMTLNKKSLDEKGGWGCFWARPNVCSACYEQLEAVLVEQDS